MLSDKLRQDGHVVVSADIKRERSEFVYANMKDKLPFCDGDFDIVICLEGLEHLINPQFAISELCRVCRIGGRVIVSTPNVQNCYSRLHFLCKGYFYQFPPPPSSLYFSKSGNRLASHITFRFPANRMVFLRLRRKTGANHLGSLEEVDSDAVIFNFLVFWFIVDRHREWF